MAGPRIPDILGGLATGVDAFLSQRNAMQEMAMKKAMMEAELEAQRQQMDISRQQLGLQRQAYSEDQSWRERDRREKIRQFYLRRQDDLNRLTWEQEQAEDEAAWRQDMADIANSSAEAQARRGFIRDEMATIQKAIEQRAAWLQQSTMQSDGMGNLVPSENTLTMAEAMALVAPQVYESYGYNYENEGLDYQKALANSFRSYMPYDWSQLREPYRQDVFNQYEVMSSNPIWRDVIGTDLMMNRPITQKAPKQATQIGAYPEDLLAPQPNFLQQIGTGGNAMIQQFGNVSPLLGLGMRQAIGGPAQGFQWSGDMLQKLLGNDYESQFGGGGRSGAR
jgi:hypothetical protein